MKQNRKLSSRQIRKAKKDKQKAHNQMLRSKELSPVALHIYQTTRTAG